MDNEEFRERGRQMIDYIAKYMETVAERRVTADVEPGYLKKLIPDHAPEKGQDWDSIMSDVETKIMPGVRRSSTEFYKYNICPKLLANVSYTCWLFCVGDSLAAPSLPRLLSLGKLFPVHPGRHAVRWHRLHRILLGIEPSLYGTGDDRARLVRQDARAARRVPLVH